MSPGDWITNCDPTRDTIINKSKPREFYEYVEMDFSRDQPRIRGFPIYMFQNPICDRTKKPHYLKSGEWRKCTDEEKAAWVVQRIRGLKP